jgi:hypothetical protein
MTHHGQYLTEVKERPSSQMVHPAKSASRVNFASVLSNRRPLHNIDTFVLSDPGRMRASISQTSSHRRQVLSSEAVVHQNILNLQEEIDVLSQDYQ